MQINMVLFHMSFVTREPQNYLFVLQYTDPYKNCCTYKRPVGFGRAILRVRTLRAPIFLISLTLRALSRPYLYHCFPARLIKYEENPPKNSSLENIRDPIKQRPP
jgi:hypothetical protein